MEGYTQDEIAEVFRVHRQTILRDDKANRKEMAKLVDQVDVEAMAGELIALASQLRAKAIRTKDYSLAWKIQRDLINDLQSLGYLPRAPEQHQVQIGTFVDLLQLASKPVEATVVDPDVSAIQQLPDQSDENTSGN
jgi:hypothetical protein